MPTKLYRYGMRARGFGEGAQPSHGLVKKETSPNKAYHDIVGYNYALPPTTMLKFQLELLDDENNPVPIYLKDPRTGMFLGTSQWVADIREARIFSGIGPAITASDRWGGDIHFALKMVAAIVTATNGHQDYLTYLGYLGYPTKKTHMFSKVGVCREAAMPMDPYMKNLAERWAAEKFPGKTLIFREVADKIPGSFAHLIHRDAEKRVTQ